MTLSDGGGESPPRTVSLGQQAIWPMWLTGVLEALLRAGNYGEVRYIRITAIQGGGSSRGCEQRASAECGSLFWGGGGNEY